MASIYKHILVATDGTELASKAVEQAGALARLAGADLSVVYVTSAPPTFYASEIGWSVPADIYDEISVGHAKMAQQIFDNADKLAGVPIKQTVHIEDSGAAEGILEAAQKVGADLIVMASHGHRGIDRLILGSQAARVLSHSTLPVLIVK